MTSTPAFVSLWIGGQSRPANNGATFQVKSPQDGRIVSVAASASIHDCRNAVDAAATAFKTWEHSPIATRREIFMKAAALFETDEYRQKVISAVMEETGAVQAWGALNVRATVNMLRETTHLSDRLRGETWPSAYPGATALMQRRAMGVILAIAPWNSPVNLTMRAVAIPIMCGNTVVLKSSEYSPRSQEVLCEVFHKAGLPPGVLNFLSVSRADSPQLTANLIGDPLVRKINFTGGDVVGRIIAIEAAKHLKPCVLELGGNCPAVVLNDADVDDASRAIIFGGMIHSGQVCMATERVIVQRDIAPSLIIALIRLASKIKAGNPSVNPSSALSCLYTEASADNVCNLIKEAVESGAEILLGDGGRAGAVVQPHIIRGVKPGMRLWERESFGPVITITEVDTVDEAIDLSNESDYSLMASLWSRSASIEMAGRLRAGSVLVNGATIHIEPQFGNAGLGGTSGYGRFDFEDWTNKRMVVLHPPKQKYPLADDL